MYPSSQVGEAEMFMEKKKVMSNSFGIVLAIPIAIAIVGKLP